MRRGNTETPKDVQLLVGVCPTCPEGAGRDLPISPYPMSSYLQGFGDKSLTDRPAIQEYPLGLNIGELEPKGPHWTHGLFSLMKFHEDTVVPLELSLATWVLRWQSRVDGTQAVCTLLSTMLTTWLYTEKVGQALIW